MQKTLILACLAGCALAACGGKNDTKAAVPAVAVTAPVTATVPSALPKADAALPVTQYQKVSAEQVVYLYHALSGLPINYDKIAEQVSVEYRSATDNFKKKEIRDALQPRIDAAIAEAKGAGRHVHLDFPRAKVSLGHYDLATKSFPIQGLPVDEGDALSISQSPYRIAFTNSSAFKTLPMADEAKARDIESLISSGTKDGVVTYNNGYPTNARLYLYAQTTESNNFAVNFQVVKLVMTTLDGRPFAEK